MKKKQLWKRIILLATTMGYIMVATGCGSETSSKQMLGSTLDYSSSNDSEKSAGAVGEVQSSDAEPASDGKGMDDTTGTNTSNKKVDTEMLIYTCHLQIDTLDYEKSVDSFKQMVTSVGGFIESERYSDGNSVGSYYVEDADKEKVFHSTVRIPHDKYNGFLDGTDQLGDVRSKESNVENVNQEYTDLGTSLSIYEAKEKRYTKLLGETKDDAYALSLEKELTELQIKIAEIKTRMNEIETDVSYSTVDITIKEVSKYNEKPAETDTFFQRLGNTLKETWDNFLIFLEGLLFFTIRVSPYALIALAVLLVLCQIQKRRKNKKPKTNITNKINKTKE